jgi:Protein of unknown function (DUF2839)
MGDAKRRKETNFNPKSERIVSWLPLTNGQSSEFVRITTKFAWVGIWTLAGGWLTVRWIGPSFGWWKIVG